MTNRICTVAGERGEYTGYSSKSGKYHVSLYNGKTLKLDSESDIVFDTVEPVKAGDNITIIGRRWFDKINGNTYFSAVALVNSKQVAEIPYEYGYGNQYEQSMFNLLYKLGYCADRKTYGNGSNEPFWVYCDRKGITKYITHSDVNRKKDL